MTDGQFDRLIAALDKITDELASLTRAIAYREHRESGGGGGGGGESCELERKKK